MGIFSREKPKPAPTVDRPLDERVRALESLVRQLDDDMSDLFDRQRRMQGRRAKRDERERDEKSPEQQINEHIAAVNGANPFYRS